MKETSMVHKYLVIHCLMLIVLATLLPAAAASQALPASDVGPDTAVCVLDNEKLLPAIAYNWKRREYLVVSAPARASMQPDAVPVLPQQMDSRLFLPLIAGIPPAAEVFIPAGNFQMGCDSNNDSCNSDEQPLHPVYLDAYYIDQYEVTRARYWMCVDAGVCSIPWPLDDCQGDCPVTLVTWKDAKKYCEWMGKRLPTEAQWEKAARGSTKTLVYPWGDGAPDCTKLNYTHYDGSSYDACVGQSSPVGSYPAGASSYGVMDMAGNVSEWVYDWYDAAYYSLSPATNPYGPTTGTYRVIRGGSHSSVYRYVRAAARDVGNPVNYVYSVVGFRCVRIP